MDIKEMRKLLGETQQQFSKRYRIPVRSLQKWEKGTGKCPVYFLVLLEKSVIEDKTAKLSNEVKRLVGRYHLQIDPSGKLLLSADDACLAQRDQMLTIISERKMDIMEYLKQKPVEDTNDSLNTEIDDISLTKDMTIKDLRLLLNCTQKEFAKKYNIPARTLEDWEYGRRNCPAHVELQLQRAVDREVEKESDMNEKK